MSTYHKFLLILIALAYLASPIDLIPDLFVPFLGWIDDTFLIGLLIYYLRFGRLPNFFYRGAGQRPGRTQQQTGPSAEQSRASANNQTKAKASQSRQMPKRAPHEILGIDKNASREEIQAAYRSLVKQYHPDRVAHLGKELQELANRKFIEIKDAYTRMLNS
ncbi:MAG: DnaJ domain-containing protein [Desulfobacteraceae bacterium]|nr:DnaJ domain-containing protein [Desulfobacteraceae bacterium]